MLSRCPQVVLSICVAGHSVLPDPPWPPTLGRELSSGWCDLEPQVPHHKETGLCPLACPSSVLGKHHLLCLECFSQPLCGTLTLTAKVDLLQRISGPTQPQGSQGLNSHSIYLESLIVKLYPLSPVSQVSIFNLRLMVRSLKAGTMLDSPSSLDKGCPTQS